MIPEKIAEDIEVKLVRKRLTKSAICKEAGISNSNLSNMLKRCRQGLAVPQEHLDAIYAAIEKLPEGAR